MDDEDCMFILANQKNFPCGILRCFLRDTAEKLQDRFQRTELRMRRIMSLRHCGSTSGKRSFLVCFQGFGLPETLR